MKKPATQGPRLLVLALILLSLTGCTQYAKVQKSMDAEYKYEMGKSYYIEGKYSEASSLLEEVLAFMKGTTNGEESLYMLAMSYFHMQDYISAAHHMSTYCTSYPRGIYAEEARYIAAMALYLDTPDPRLDQSSTIKAINEIQLFLEYYPYSRHKRDVQDMLFELQDRLVEKEYRAAQLYFNLGNYMGNNYQACVITAQNALKDYPYTSFREDLSFLVVKAKYQMAKESVVEKMLDRYRDAVDECYAFQNEFPESRYYKDSEQMLHNAQKAIKGL